MLSPEQPSWRLPARRGRIEHHRHEEGEAFPGRVSQVYSDFQTIVACSGGVNYRFQGLFGSDRRHTYPGQDLGRAVVEFFLFHNFNLVFEVLQK